MGVLGAFGASLGEGWRLEPRCPAAQEPTGVGGHLGLVPLALTCSVTPILLAKGRGEKKRLLHGINMLYVPLSHAISLHRCAGIFIPSRNV